MAPPQPLRLRHLHLPSLHPHYVPYTLASRVQEHLRREHLAFKDAAAHQDGGVSSRPPSPPPPALISFTPSPIFTLGRRQTAPLTRGELARLTAPLEIAPPPPFAGLRGAPAPTAAPALAPAPAQAQAQAQAHVPSQARARTAGQGTLPAPPSHPHPRVLASPRGGLTTYHGPGQVVLWPVIDLRAVGPEAAAAAAARLSCCAPAGLRGGGGGLTVRTYARLLETTTAAVLGRAFGLEAVTTEDPGVWVVRQPLLQRRQQQQLQQEGAGAEAEIGEAGSKELAKIAALGVHLRRHITALGTALNVALPGTDSRGDGGGNGSGDERTNPWSRFVACGLAGKGVTSVAGELARRARKHGPAAAAAATATVNAAGDLFRGGVELLDEMLLRQQRFGAEEARTREQAVADAWAEEFARGIGLEHDGRGSGAVERVGTEEVLGLMERLVRSAQEQGGKQAGHDEEGEGGADAAEHLGEELEYLDSIRRLLGVGA
ncbi:hypothetical protein VTJ83DRAFT_3708 [Remersonia thermophila]|uniref:BPL/LPL catalytic domain-containing protein n=1 Tax=Remersonia thermophila TaxID=72144 RepID=A0ABR4DGZ0_9PEZI